MLPRQHRLVAGADFRATTRPGREASAARAAHELMVLHAVRQPTRTGMPARVGFVVSKAVGGSVVRHRVTRRLRAQVWFLLATVPTGVDLVIRANPVAAQASSADLAAALERLLARVSSRLTDASC